MSRWFRMYSDAIRNPKVAALSDRDYRTWISLLSVASENDGAIPPLASLKHLLMMRLDHLSLALDRLVKVGLIDLSAHGYEPHSWNKFQYKSDTSKERVTLHRAKKPVTPVTPPEADTEADTEKKISSNDDCASDDALAPQHIADAWNEIADRIGKPKVRDLTPERRQRLKARIAGYSLDDWRAVLSSVEQSAFLRGDTGWTGCTFDWITKKANFQKILEGNYNGEPPKQPRLAYAR